MGLFDGASGRGELASTAHVAKLLDAPRRCSSSTPPRWRARPPRSCMAIARSTPTCDVAGVIFNRVGSRRPRAAAARGAGRLGVPVLGALRRDERVATPERHLGLVPADEREARAREALDALAAAIGALLSTSTRSLRLARARAGSAPGPAWSPEARARPCAGARIAIARGPAFSFHYEENLELLRGRGRRARGRSTRCATRRCPRAPAR